MVADFTELAITPEDLDAEWEIDEKLSVAFPDDEPTIKRRLTEAEIATLLQDVLVSG
jgi:hypothetical protein